MCSVSVSRSVTIGRHSVSVGTLSLPPYRCSRLPGQHGTQSGVTAEGLCRVYTRGRRERGGRHRTPPLQQLSHGCGALQLRNRPGSQRPRVIYPAARRRSAEAAPARLVNHSRVRLGPGRGDFTVWRVRYHPLQRAAWVVRCTCLLSALALPLLYRFTVCADGSRAVSVSRGTVFSLHQAGACPRSPTPTAGAPRRPVNLRSCLRQTGRFGR